MASALTKGTSNVIGDIAATGEQHKDRLREQKRSLQGGYASHQYNMMADTSGVDRMTSALTNAATSLGNAWSTRSDIPTSQNPPMENNQSYVLRIGDQERVINPREYMMTSIR
jgi:hypothetical protein